MADKRTYYEVLGILRTATTKEIQAAFRKRMKEHHPDKFTRMRANVTDPEILELIDKQAKESAEEAKLINEAYAVLSEPSKRRRYDQGLADQAPKLPDIRISKTLIQFGRLTKGETKSLSFVVTNVGGPVTTIHIDWEKEPNWAELVIRPDPNTTFPIEVEIRVDADKANPGLRQAKILVDADGISASVDIQVTVVAPAPQPAPPYTPPPTPPPTPPKKARWPVIAVVVGIVLLSYLWVTSGNKVQQPQEQFTKSAPQQQIQTSATVDIQEEAEKQQALSNPKGILLGNRVGSINCNELFPSDTTCDVSKWATYQFRNNGKRLNIGLDGFPGACVDKQGKMMTLILRPGETVTLYCREVHYDIPMDVCTNVWFYTDKQLPYKYPSVAYTRLCWNK